MIPEAGLPDWNSDVDDVLVCSAVRQETHDVKSFVFAPRRPSLFRFRPGQFLTLDVPLPGGTINRCYTISSSPARPHRLSITVKRVPGGPVSNWLHDHLKPGDIIRAAGPMGEFSPEAPREATKYLFLSGGSGITPLMSMTRCFDDLGERRDIVFVHAARTPDDIIFRAELDLMARHGQGLRVAHVCEGLGDEPGWPGYGGRLSLAMLRLIAPDFLERDVFCCGPAPFMAAVRTILAEGGYAMDRYRQESFNFEEEFGAAAPEPVAPEPVAPEPVAPEVAEAAGGRFRIEFAKSGRIVECDASTMILDAALSAGMRLPSSCTRGLCGTCKSRKLSGEVDMQHAGGIRQREIDQGMILLCCSRPTSDLVIDR